MAISATHYALLKELKQQGVLPQGGRILEIGQANWYGDWDASEFAPLDDAFGVITRMYLHLFHPEALVAIDLDPAAESALKLDLNKPINLRQTFDTIFNHGTMEHIANDQQVMINMHDHCEVGGLMIHEAPFTGWHDHGFRCYQPTFFYDHAAANGYDIVLMACEHLASRTYFKIGSREHTAQLKRQGQLADNLMLFVVFRKTTDEPFKVPMQGVYAGTVSEQGHQDWRELR